MRLWKLRAVARVRELTLWSRLRTNYSHNEPMPTHGNLLPSRRRGSVLACGVTGSRHVFKLIKSIQDAGTDILLLKHLSNTAY